VDQQEASQRQSAGDVKNGDNEQATSSLVISCEIVQLATLAHRVPAQFGAQIEHLCRADPVLQINACIESLHYDAPKHPTNRAPQKRLNPRFSPVAHAKSNQLEVVGFHELPENRIGGKMVWRIEFLVVDSRRNKPAPICIESISALLKQLQRKRSYVSKVPASSRRSASCTLQPFIYLPYDFARRVPATDQSRREGCGLDRI
jgi:hypothetical protein